MAADKESVFVNCPFDEKFEPILQAILFCIIFLGYKPRISSESNDSAQVRINKIVSLIRDSKYSIHDLSRSQSTKKNEYARHNMPFELGIDFGSLNFGEGKLREKRFLVMDSKRYRHTIALSDMAGCDIQTHNNDFLIAMRKVRNWLVTEAGAPKVAAQQIANQYYAFQEWDYERQMASGASEEDIQDYPTAELMSSMEDWMAAGQPPTF